MIFPCLVYSSQAFLLAQSSATSCSSSNNDSYHDGVGADDTSSASNKGKPSRPPLSQRTSSQSKNASKLSLFGALGFSTYALRRSGSHNGGSALRMPQPRSIDKGTTMEDVVVDKDGLGWLKLGNFRASKQDFALHSDDRLGVRRYLQMVSHEETMTTYVQFCSALFFRLNCRLCCAFLVLFSYGRRSFAH